MAEKPEAATDAPAEAPQTTDDEWEQISTGIGREWDFDKDGPLVANWVSVETVDLKPPFQKDPDGNDRTKALAYVFADTNGEQVFLWESHELSQALTQAGVGDKLRISFLGRESFTGDDGPRQVKRYKVERAVTR